MAKFLKDLDNCSQGERGVTMPKSDYSVDFILFS